LLFRAAATGHVRDTERRFDARSALFGVWLLEIGLALAFGREPAGAVAAAFVASAALVVLTTWALRLPDTGSGIIRTSDPAAPNLWGLAPVNAVAGLTAIGFAIRLLIERGLWLDEAISVQQARLGFAPMIDALRHGDIHPPLHAFVLWVTVRVFGTSSLAVRMPSILAGTLLIPLLYLAGRDIHNRRAGVMAAALGTFAPLLVWYSQEARMYAILLVFSVASLWFQVRAMKWGRTLDWLAFGACCAGMLWAHYFSALQIIVQHIALAVAALRMRRNREPARELLQGWGRAVALMFLLLAPLAPFLRDQLASSAQLGGLDVPSRNPDLDQLSIYAILANSIWALWGYHSPRAMQQLVALWPLVMLFVLFLLGRGRPRVMWMLSAAALVPVAVLFLAGLRLRDLFEVRYFLTAVPVLILIVAQFVSRVDISRAATGVTAIALLGTFGVALADQQINHRNPRLYDFEGSLSYVEEHAQRGDMLLYAPRYLDAVVEYYTPDVRSRALMRGSPQQRPERLFVVMSPTLLDRREPQDRLSEIVEEATTGRTLVDEHDEERVTVEVWR
jgi:uncharacterized membrane protein